MILITTMTTKSEATKEGMKECFLDLDHEVGVNLVSLSLPLSF
jgi:hypothetical protein